MKVHSALPDFTQAFFRETVEPLRFKARPGPNFVHDVHFLSGYLHDARFTPESLMRRGRKLSIPFGRGCWEFGLTDGERPTELYIAQARLDLEPVADARWEIESPEVLKQELWVGGIYPGPAHWEEDEASELVITGRHQGWRLVIALADDYPAIRLRDLEQPYLYSRREKAGS